MSEQDSSEPTRPLLLLGLGGVALAVLLGMLAPHDGALWRLPLVLEQRVETALLASGQGGLEIKLDGQRALLSGLVEDQADIAAAESAALRAAGAGGLWAGGISEVDVSGVSVGAFARPYLWSARREAARLVLSGSVPSEAARDDLMAAAASAFPSAERIDSMQVAGGAPSPSFTDTARTGIRLLAGLHSGEVRFVDSHMVVIGDGGQEAADALRAAFANPPAPFRVRLDVTVDGLDPEHPELQGLDLAAGGAETCATAFDRLMEGNVINFASASALIDPASRATLDSLATVALRCDRFSIEVAGHTDNVGAREMNMNLSRQRADAVAEYLTGQGVAAQRLTARGYGPDRPRAANANAAGQAQNRRIEFYVSD